MRDLHDVAGEELGRELSQPLPAVLVAPLASENQPPPVETYADCVPLPKAASVKVSVASPATGFVAVNEPA